MMTTHEQYLLVYRLYRKHLDQQTIDNIVSASGIPQDVANAALASWNMSGERDAYDYFGRIWQRSYDRREELNLQQRSRWAGKRVLNNSLPYTA